LLRLELDERELLRADGLELLLLLRDFELLLRADGLLELLLLLLRDFVPLERELLLRADGLLELLLLRDLDPVERELLPLLALARVEDDRDDFGLLEEVLVSPFSARSLFTVRAAISAARPFWPRFS